MKLYATKIPTISEEVIRVLADAGDIETENRPEAQLDVEAVLREYLRLDREVTDGAKETLEARKLDYGQFGQLKRKLAEERGLALGEEAPTWIANQVVESFMHSPHIDEVFTEEGALRKKIRELVRKQMQVDDELDAEVRRRIKNLSEGTTAWELEYGKTLDQIKRKHGLS